MTIQLINKLAFAEGWGIFFTDQQDATHNLYELQKLDESEDFESDDAAIAWVVISATLNPKGFHAEALLFLANNSPNEIDSVVRSAVSPSQFAALKEVLRYTEFDKF